MKHRHAPRVLGTALALLLPPSPRTMIDAMYSAFQMHGTHTHRKHAYRLARAGRGTRGPATAAAPIARILRRCREGRGERALQVPRPERLLQHAREADLAVARDVRGGGVPRARDDGRADAQLAQRVAHLRER